MAPSFDSDDSDDRFDHHSDTSPDRSSTPNGSSIDRLISLGLGILPFSPLVGLSLWLGVMIWGIRNHGTTILHRPLTWFWGGVALLLVISCTQAQFPTDAWLGLANFLPFFGVFVVFRELLKTAQQWLILCRVWSLTVIPIVLLGLGPLLHLWHGPVFILGLVDWSLPLGGNPPGRITSVFAYTNVLASYLTLTLPLTLGLWCQAWQTPQNQPQNQTVSPWLSVKGDRLLWSGVLLLQGLGILLTHSRNGWLLTALITLAFALYNRWYLYLGLWFGGTIAIFWAAFGTWGHTLLRQWIPRFIWGRLNDQLYPDRAPADLRIHQWQFAWQLSQQHPWLGVGLRNFSPLYKAALGNWLGHPHNFFLMLSAEVGLPTLGLFLGGITYILGRAIVQNQNSLHHQPRPNTQGLLLFSTLLAFASSTLFHCFDITFFDARINVLNWFLLAAISGIKTWQEPSHPSQYKT